MIYDIRKNMSDDDIDKLTLISQYIKDMIKNGYTNDAAFKLLSDCDKEFINHYRSHIPFIIDYYNLKNYTVLTFVPLHPNVIKSLFKIYNIIEFTLIYDPLYDSYIIAICPDALKILLCYLFIFDALLIIHNKFYTNSQYFDPYRNELFIDEKLSTLSKFDIEYYFLKHFVYLTQQNHAHALYNKEKISFAFKKLWFYNVTDAINFIIENKYYNEYNIVQ